MSWMCNYGFKRAQKKRAIQQQLDEASLNQSKLAVIAGVSRQSVSQTLNGAIHSQKVLNALRGIGVPESLLFDPRKDITNQPKATL